MELYYRKLHMRFRLVPRPMTSDDLNFCKFKFSWISPDFADLEGIKG